MKEIKSEMERLLWDFQNNQDIMQKHLIAVFFSKSTGGKQSAYYDFNYLRIQSVSFNLTTLCPIYTVVCRKKKE